MESLLLDKKIEYTDRNNRQNLGLGVDNDLEEYSSQQVLSESDGQHTLWVLAQKLSNMLCSMYHNLAMFSISEHIWLIMSQTLSFLGHL